MVIECFGDHNSSDLQFLDEVLLGQCFIYTMYFLKLKFEFVKNKDLKEDEILPYFRT